MHTLDIDAVKISYKIMYYMIQGDMVVNPWTGAPWSRKYYEILEKRQRLPVYEFKDELEDKVRRHQIIVVEGETGSGRVVFVG